MPVIRACLLLPWLSLPRDRRVVPTRHHPACDLFRATGELQANEQLLCKVLQNNRSVVGFSMSIRQMLEQDRLQSGTLQLKLLLNKLARGLSCGFL